MNKNAYFKMLGLEKKALNLPKLVPNLGLLRKLPGRARKAVQLQAIRKIIPINQLSRIAKAQEALKLHQHTKHGWTGFLSKRLESAKTDPWFSTSDELASKLYQRDGRIPKFFSHAQQWQDGSLSQRVADTLNRLTNQLGRTLGSRRHPGSLGLQGDLKGLASILKQLKRDYNINLRS